MPRTLLVAAALFAAACSAAHADQPIAARSPARIALGIAPAKIRAPYDVQIMRAGGESLPTYQLRDRFYVQGEAGERYIIRITNPTSRRIEAVVSVDGLDVIDGENGDLRKRGYVVPPYGETRIEGFRTSQADVATFRFSSVGASYAGQKGKARNVGVIAVALFEEQEREPEQIIIQGGPIRRHRRPYDYRRDLDGRAPSPSADAAPGHRELSESAPAKDDDGISERSSTAKRSEAPAARPAAPPYGGTGRGAPADYDDEIAPDVQRPAQERLGLGTEFGEQRSSAASFTRFVRAHRRPVAVAELRYNDADGLLALGIPLYPMPDMDEVMTRETANPFPGDRFARPPR